uniref:Protein SCAR n=1 Tax=Davidia involucrata TaxID=16924 RepID=A0A5B6ZMX3_DAVIN
MPLVRVQVRNEYGLGVPELYKETNREDPKAVLDGVAVSGLVGILRQLGDLAEFAAEVFHGLQEQAMATASRSHKLMVRVKHIEAALPLLEKAVLSQRSHLHFAYTAGSDWHAHVQNEQNHFIYNDLPRFIMDSYEECHDPPRLHLLDKFDTGGPGSCLKRYSDPSFFKRASARPDEANAEKVPRGKKVHKSKKKRAWQRNGEVSRGASISNQSGRMQLASLNVDEQTSPSQTVSTFNVALKSYLGDKSNSFDSRTGSAYIECVLDPSYCMKPEEHEPKETSSSRIKMQHNDSLDFAFVDEQRGIVDDDSPCSSSQEQTGPSSSSATWEEKTEIVERKSQQYDHEETLEMFPTNFDLDAQEREVVNFRIVDQMDLQFDNENTPTSIFGGNQLDDIESEPDTYMDALNTIESESETDIDCQTKQEVKQYSNFNDEGIEDGMHGLKAHNLDCHPSNFESQTAAFNFSNKGTSCDKPYPVSLGSYAHEQSPQLVGKSSTCGDTPCINLCGNADILDGLQMDSVISNTSNFVSRETVNSTAHEQSPQMAGKSSSCGDTPGINLCEDADILDGSQMDSVISNTSYFGSRETNPQAPTSDKIIISSCESQKSPTELSGVHSVTFWTNGGLLGLQPSKPPDCSILNAVSQYSLTRSKEETSGPSSQSNILKGDGHAGKPDISAKCFEIIEQNPSSKCSTSCHNDQEDGISIKKPSWRFSPADLDVKLEKYGDSHHSNRFNHSHRHGLNETGVATPGTKQPANPDVKAVSTEASHKDGENSSRIYGLSSGMLGNGFRRNVSLAQDENSDIVSSVKTGVFEQKSRDQSVVYQTSSETTCEYFGTGPAVNSPASSPPLEHMKISFEPINGFETSKLTLKFPDQNHCHESSRDMFPSFQLVPEHAILPHDVGSDSEDDTFCRSSPYMSDDCLSHHSESNSEQWESSEILQGKDHELYDALCRISSSDSVSSSPDLEGTPQGSIRIDCGIQGPCAENGVEPSQSGPLLDLPSFDSLNPLYKQEIKNNSDAKDLQELDFPKEPTPLPPPLPPLQWRVMKSHSDVAGDKQDAVSETLNHAFDMKLSGSDIYLQPKPSLVKQQQNIEEATAFTLKSKPDQQKLNERKEANQAANGDGMDEKEDFLHQIRAKSFSLKRTVTVRPTFAPGPASNVKVTAILEKANAIRQAVGSDDGDDDDDNWSDT